MIRFSEMKYERPELEPLKEAFTEITGRFRAAQSYEEARAIFLEMDGAQRHLQTMHELASIRNSIDSRDSFYDEEMNFWNASIPTLQPFLQSWKLALLASPFRAEFSAEFGEVMFLNTEIELKTFLPDEKFIALLQKENALTQEYENLLASAAIPFEGGIYTLSQLTPIKSDPDDARRLAAWKADGAWYKENQERLDAIYDELVGIRDSLGRMLGYDGYTELGYYRMGRNCYTKDDVEKFRAAVVKYLVPVADAIYRRQAKRLGKEYPMSFADNNLEFRSGNPRPCGTADELLAAGRKFYEELSPEAGEFFATMLDCELMNVLSTEGKHAGGYCTGIPDYKAPFIFANFNGTQGDVEVITHEAGHAFEVWMNRERVPVDSCWPSMEACEVHSMSMEFFGEDKAEYFFGDDARKFRYSHLASAITFIPYGTMVDHFQHVVYEKPEMTPAERHAVWKELLTVYMPWMKLDGDIPFYSEGEGWQRQHHIYSMPFYYIDYCLAQTVALEFWEMIGEDRNLAWERYMAYTLPGGSMTFLQLLKEADLDSPFDENCLKKVCGRAAEVLESFDLSGIV